MPEAKKTEFGYTLDRWEWQDSAAGPALTHTSHPHYRILHKTLVTVGDLVRWLTHLSQKNWIKKDDLLVVAMRFHEKNGGEASRG